MTVLEYIERSNYAEQIKNMFRKSGLDYFLNRWAHKCKLISEGFYFVIDEYINELHVRSYIDPVMEHCEAAETDRAKMERLDSIFMEYTVEISYRLDRSEIKKTRDNWYYFRVPEYLIKDWYIDEGDIIGSGAGEQAH